MCREAALPTIGFVYLLVSSLARNMQIRETNAYH